MKGKVIVFVLVLALAVTAGTVMAQGARRGAAGPGPGPGTGAGPGGPGMWCPGFGFGPRIAAELGLSDAQTAQLKQIRDDCAAATETTREQLRVEAQKMAQLWAAPQPNGDAIKAQGAVIDALKADLRNIGVDYAIAGLNVLTAEQRQKLQAMAKDRRGWGAGMGPGCGMMCGQWPGMGPGGGKGAWGAGSGMGPRDGSGPRGGTPYCPKAN